MQRNRFQNGRNAHSSIQTCSTPRGDLPIRQAHHSNLADVVPIRPIVPFRQHDDTFRNSSTIQV
jgi:hypothetical protein